MTALLCDILPEDGERTHTVADLQAGECRWPVGPEVGLRQRFCCDEAEPGKPYCTCHMDAAYPRRRR